MNKYTVIGEIWNNNQGYAGQVEAEDEEGAIAQAQNECLEAVNDEIENPLDQRTDEPLKIWAVVAGWPEVLYSHGE